MPRIGGHVVLLGGRPMAECTVRGRYARPVDRFSGLIVPAGEHRDEHQGRAPHGPGLSIGRQEARRHDQETQDPKARHHGSPSDPRIDAAQKTDGRQQQHQSEQNPATHPRPRARREARRPERGPRNRKKKSRPRPDGNARARPSGRIAEEPRGPMHEAKARGAVVRQPDAEGFRARSTPSPAKKHDQCDRQELESTRPRDGTGGRGHRPEEHGHKVHAASTLQAMDDRATAPKYRESIPFS